MKPFEEEAALFRFGVVTVGPESGDSFGLARSGRAVNLAQSGFDFLLLALHFEGIEEVLV